jgi:hypothetical protein
MDVEDMETNQALSLVRECIIEINKALQESARCR